MTTLTLANRVLEHFGHATGSLSTTAGARVLGHLNQWHRRILCRPGCESLRYTTVSVDSVASTPTITLPSLVARVLAVRDTANRRTLQEHSFSWYRIQESDPTAAPGTPSAFVRVGTTQLATCAASGLWVVSSEAADSMDCAVVGGSATAAKTATVTLNGTTRVAVGTDTDWTSIGLSLASVAAGTISVYDADTDGNVLLTIPPGELRYTAPLLALWPCPSAVLTYTIDVERAIRDLTSSDVPWLPEDFQWLLEQGGKVSEYERLDDNRLTVARRELEIGISEMRRFLAADPVLIPGSRQTGFSRLNGWCPADRWSR